MDDRMIKNAFENGVGESVRRSDTMNKDTFYYAILLDNGTVLRVSIDAGNIWSVFVAATPMILLVIMVLILVGVVLSHLLTRQIISPIETMAQNIEDTTTEPPYKELVPFAKMIRSQHADILSSAKARQDFTANVSHELKTPLTSMKVLADSLLAQDDVPVELYKEFMGDIAEEIERENKIINDLLSLVKMDKKASDLNVKAENINETDPKVVFDMHDEEVYAVWMEELYQQVDRYLGKLMHYLDEGWSFIITSDHAQVAPSYVPPHLGDMQGINVQIMEELGYTKTTRGNWKMRLSPELAKHIRNREMGIW